MNEEFILHDEVSVYDVLNTDSLEERAVKAAIAEEKAEKDNRREEEYREGSLKRFFNLLKRDATRFKSEILIILCYLLVLANLIFVVITGIIDFFTIDTIIRPRNQPLLVIIESLIPFLVWMWSSKYDVFNFYRVKFFTFAGCILNWILLTFACFRIAIMRLMRLVFFSIPTSGSLKPVIVVISYYVFAGIIILFALLVVCIRVRRNIHEKIMYRKIVQFRVARLLPDIPGQRKFSYDMCIVRNLSTGKMHRIYEKDRRLHSKVVGSTGGGKTATVGTVAYENDLRQKVHNIDYQKKKIKKLLDRKKVYMTCDFEDIDFSIDYVKPVPELEEREYNKIASYLKKLKYKAKNAGITFMCPNKAFCDELYEKAKAKGLRVNRVDPCADIDGSFKEDLIGFSPIYVPLIAGEEEDSYMFRVFTAAKLYADVNQAIFELSGKGDPYFTGLNKNLSVTAAVTVIIAYPLLHPGEYATIGHVQEVINDFKLIQPYRDAMIEKYGKTNEVGAVVKTAGSVDVGPNLQFIVDRIDRDFLGPNSLKINEQATGLRNIIDESLMNPRIRNILCAEKTLDIDRALEMGELTLVNFEISLGSDSTGFGMFFMLSFIQAVLRRPGTENTRLPHFFCIDEAPMLFHPKLELSTTLFRQYNVAMLLFMQSLTQYEKNDTTKYLKNVLTGNCAHQIIFGRASREDMEFYEKLSGYKWELEETESVRESALTDENTVQQFTHNFELEQNERISTDDIRYREFLECTVFSAKNSTPLEPFIGKTNFLPQGYNPRMSRYRVNWHRYFDASLTVQEDEKEIIGYNKEGAVISITGYTVAEKNGETVLLEPDVPLFSARTIKKDEISNTESEEAVAEEGNTLDEPSSNDDSNEDDWEKF